MKHIFNFKFGFFFFVGIVLGLLYVLISDSNKVSESDVKEKLDEIFQIVDNDVDRFGEIVTDDFFIFENSKRYNAEEFIDFVKSFDIIESKREFKNVEIDTDFNSAHVSLEHHGEFDINTPDGKVRLIFDWLGDGKSITIAYKMNGKENKKTCQKHILFLTGRSLWKCGR